MLDWIERSRLVITVVSVCGLALQGWCIWSAWRAWRRAAAHEAAALAYAALLKQIVITSFALRYGPVWQAWSDVTGLDLKVVIQPKHRSAPS